MQTCTKCQKEKLPGNFYDRFDTLGEKKKYSWCKECIGKRQKNYKQNKKTQ